MFWPSISCDDYRIGMLADQQEVALTASEPITTPRGRAMRSKEIPDQFAFLVLQLVERRQVQVRRPP